MPRSSLSQFHELAEFYDPLNAHKDYRRETARLQRIVRQVRTAPARSWLDVACGTGRHLDHLRRSYRVAGVDASPEMLRIARRRLPGVRLVHADMRRFRLGERYDVVSCLFSAIGHLRTEWDVQEAFANFARHLNPGGVVVVEPWIDPTRFRTGFIHLVTSDGPNLKLARCSSSERRGTRSRVHFHYLIGRPHQEIQYRHVVDDALLLSRAKLARMMRRVGLRTRFVSAGLTPGRGLFVGVRGGSRE